MAIWSFIVTNILRNPPILLALVSVLGSLLLGKKFSVLIKTAVLAAAGMLMLTMGVDILVSSISPVNTVFRMINGVEIQSGLDASSFIAVYGGEIGMAMLLGLVLHLGIARFTPVKTIFLTGHFLYWFPQTFVAAGVEAGLTGVTLVVFGGVCAALYWSLMPWCMRKLVWAVTKDESWMMGHPTGILSIIAGGVAKVVGNKEKSTEDLKIPESLSFLKETTIIGFIVIFILYVVCDIAFNGAFSEYANQNIVFYAINMGLTFSVGLQVLLAGVRMLINQIVPAFEGISRKLVPNAIPAYDCPMLFPYKPNALIIGFIVALVSSIPAIIFVNSTNLLGIMTVPVVITCFFELGAASIIADGQGGLRGAIIGTAVAAVVMIFLAGTSAVLFDQTIQNQMLSSRGNDTSLFGMIALWIGTLLKSIGL